MYFKKLQYHVSYNGGSSIVTHNFFTSETVLMLCVNWWNTKTREWKYWLTAEDEEKNSVVTSDDLPYLCGGFCHPTPNGFIFNSEPTVDYQEFLRDGYQDRYNPILAPGIIS